MMGRAEGAFPVSWCGTEELCCQGCPRPELHLWQRAGAMLREQCRNRVGVEETSPVSPRPPLQMLACKGEQRGMGGLCEKPQPFSAEGTSFPEQWGDDLPLLLHIASGERSCPGGTSPPTGYMGTMVVEVLPLLLPRALGAGQDSLLIPHSSSSGFFQSPEPSWHSPLANAPTLMPFPHFTVLPLAFVARDSVLTPAAVP